MSKIIDLFSRKKPSPAGVNAQVADFIEGSIRQCNQAISHG